MQKSPIETAKQSANEMNGRGNGSDASSRCADVHSAGNEAQMAIVEAKSVRTPPNEPKMQNSPAGAERRRAGMAEGFRSHTDMLTMRKDTHNVAHDVGTAENVSRNIRSHQNGPKTKNSPNADEFVTPKCVDRRRWVSADGINVNISLYEVLDTASQKVVFGRIESGGEAKATNVEGDKAGDGDGDRYGDDGDGDDTESSSSIDSQRVESAQLSTESQPMCPHEKSQENSPVSSRPPTKQKEHPYRLIRQRRGCGRIKFIPAKVSQMRKVEMTYLGCANSAQPHRNESKCSYRVIGPSCRRNRIEIEPAKLKIKRLNDKRGQNGERTYLGRMHIAQPPKSLSKRLYRVIGLVRWRRRHGRIKIA